MNKTLSRDEHSRLDSHVASSSAGPVGQHCGETAADQYILSCDPFDGRKLALGGDIPHRDKLDAVGLTIRDIDEQRATVSHPLLLVIFSFISCSVRLALLQVDNAARPHY